jgi:hypothetical protein
VFVDEAGAVALHYRHAVVRLDDAGVWRVVMERTAHWLRYAGRQWAAPSGWKPLDIWLRHDDIDAAVFAGLKPGRNVLWVYCHQAVSGQQIGVGLLEVRDPPK